MTDILNFGQSPERSREQFVQRYQNLDGDSGVTHYQTGPGFIRVRFRNGVTYVYDSERPGAQHVERMQELARAGEGLSTYISRFVRTSYARREEASS